MGIEFLVTQVYNPLMITPCFLFYAKSRDLVLGQQIHKKYLQPTEFLPAFNIIWAQGEPNDFYPRICYKEAILEGLSWSTWLIPGRLWWKILCWVPEVTQRNAYVSTLEKYHLHSSSKLFWKCRPSEEFMPDPIKVMVIKSGKMIQMARNNRKC